MNLNKEQSFYDQARIAVLLAIDTSGLLRSPDKKIRLFLDRLFKEEWERQLIEHEQHETKSSHKEHLYKESQI